MSVCELCSIGVLGLSQNATNPDNIITPLCKFLCAHLLNAARSSPVPHSSGNEVAEGRHDKDGS